MTRQLVFVHGRSQQHKDASGLKQEWIKAWEIGLGKAKLALPLPEQDIHFPYYGDTLDQLANGIPVGEAAKIIIKGNGQSDGTDQAAQSFDIEVLDEIRRRWKITDAQLDAIAGRRVAEKGIQNWPFVLAVLRALDTLVPEASSQAIALFTQDVYDYLTNQDIRDTIDDGVAEAMNKASAAGNDVIVVAHSLGTVVAYNTLTHHPDRASWTVPLFVTVGSPLGISAINGRIRNLGIPREQRVPLNVRKWFNAMDHRDVVALYALDRSHFALDEQPPTITNKSDVDNNTPNRHGIGGYLGDSTVAASIHSAVVDP